MVPSPPDDDLSYEERAALRRTTARTRIVPLTDADTDDRDDVASTAADRVATVDMLSATARRAGA